MGGGRLVKRVVIIRQHVCTGHPVGLHPLKGAARPAEDGQALLRGLYEPFDAMQAFDGLSGHRRSVEVLGLLLWLLQRGEGNGLDIRVQRAWVILASSGTRPPDSELDSMSACALQPALYATLKRGAGRALHSSAPRQLVG